MSVTMLGSSSGKITDMNTDMLLASLELSGVFRSSNQNRGRARGEVVLRGSHRGDAAWLGAASDSTHRDGLKRWPSR